MPSAAASAGQLALDAGSALALLGHGDAARNAAGQGQPLLGEGGDATLHLQELGRPVATVVDGLLHGCLVEVAAALVDVLAILHVLPEAVDVLRHGCAEPGVGCALALQIGGHVARGAAAIREHGRLVRVVAVASSRVVQRIQATIVERFEVDVGIFDEVRHHGPVALLYSQEQGIAAVGVQLGVHVNALLDALLDPGEVAEAHRSPHSMVILLHKLRHAIDGVIAVHTGAGIVDLCHCRALHGVGWKRGWQ
mmetsp:Transcript_22469/g.48004  ORF Transcript_22469/g.48004 Transcript_22469/m.48004 type:complete len:252 (+) Transcript_22469:156-911(+)